MKITPLLNTGLTLKGKGVELPKASKTNDTIRLKRNAVEIKEEQMRVQPKSLIRFSETEKEERNYSYLMKKQKDISKRISEERESLTHKETIKQIRKQIQMKKRIETNIQTRMKKISSTCKAKKCTCGDCEECLKDFTYFLHIFSHDQSVPVISSKSWCIWRKGKNTKFNYYYGKRIHKVREIASLTKMITAMVTIDFLYKFEYHPDRVSFVVRKSPTLIGGTTANLKVDEIYTVTELLYGLMLPSGNDAAIMLSELIGLLQNLKNKNKQVNPEKADWYQDFVASQKNYSHLFIGLMNEKCQKLGLIDTHIYNSHGNDAFDQAKNTSTCNEIAKVSAQFMVKYEQLKRIVCTKKFQIDRYEKVWENTNKLLQDGFDGIKTGITETAGPCLSACYKDLIIVVLNSKSMNERWIEVKKLVRWIFRKGI